MKKVMKTFTFGSKGFMRILLLCMIACFSLTQARADYYYKVKLAYMNGDPYLINGKEWSDWIFVSKGSGLANALNKLIGGTFSEQEKDNNNKLKFKYIDNDVEREISFTENERDDLTKNGDGKYIYVNGGKEYVLDPVMKDVKRLGRTIKDESGQDITLGYTNEGQIMSTDENYYTKYTHTYKIVGMAIGRGTDDGDILQNSDWDAFSRMKNDLKELDLAAWSKEEFKGSYYMSNMTNLETLILPDHNFAIGDEYTFSGANNLTAIRYGHYDAYYKTLTITDDCNVTCIGKGAFKHGYNIPQATIQTMINKAAAYAKANPNANKDGFKYNKIGDEAFYQCYKIKTLTIPDGIAEIGYEAFAENNIEYLNCPAAITVIGGKAFRDNKSLETFTIGANIDKIDEEAFINDDKLQNLTSGNKIGTIGKKAFQACYGLNRVDIKNVNTIGQDAFNMDAHQSALTSVSLGGDNIQIESNAFKKCGWLTSFNLKENAKITSIKDCAFLDCRTITSQAVNTIIANYAKNSTQTVEVNGAQVKYVPQCLFYGANGYYDYHDNGADTDKHANLTEVDIPAEFGAIGAGAFAVSETSNINKITVHRNIAPVCGITPALTGGIWSSPTFNGIVANHVTVYFNGDAAGYSTNGSTGYMTYRKESEFMRLMTKTLKEDDETYDVYPQMYADVKLTRSFKQGWNTLALPFGSPSYPKGRDMDCAEVYTKALGATDIAVYRGLRVNNQDASKSVFTFLHYGNVKEDPLDEFEPILVKMPATVTKQEYTFENVDLNYDKDNKTLYTAAQILERGCKNSKDGHFDGKYNDGDPVKFPLFNGNNYTTFYFDGTFKMIKDESNSIFKEGDYIIQDGKFIMCKTGKKYGMKAFRGYFKKFDSAPLGAREAINIAVFDGDGTVTDIVRVDANGEAEANAPHDIYNIMGQKVRSNALSTEGLKSGIYIINGKKVLVK